MIELTEATLDKVRDITKHRAVIRTQLVDIRLAKARGIERVSITFISERKRVEMAQGDRGGLAKDLAYAFEQHLEEKDEELTKALADLGVVVK